MTYSCRGRTKTRYLHGKDPIDYNAADQKGIGRTQGTSKDGTRMSAAEVHIFKQLKERRNDFLHVATDPLVPTILFEGVTATGVG